MLLRKVGAPYFFLPCSIPLCKCTIVFDPLIYSWALRLFPMLGYCKIVLLRTLGCIGSFGLVFQDFQGITLAVELLGHRHFHFGVVVFFSKFHTVFHSGGISLHSHQQCTSNDYLILQYTNMARKNLQM